MLNTSKKSSNTKMHWYGTLPMKFFNPRIIDEYFDHQYFDWIDTPSEKKYNNR